jgi:flagellar basal-body rod modification protein FlgD
MAVSDITSATGTTLTGANTGVNPDSVLGKDDFMKLLLVELQHQDPTEPMDSEKILSQTSQLATLEASENTNNALAELAASLKGSMNFNTISAIGKMADLGSNAVVLDEDGDAASFEMYFPDDYKSGQINIMDPNGNTVASMELEPGVNGVHGFTWDGGLSDGSAAEAGYYYITADYLTTDNLQGTTRMGAYPIESVRFDGDTTMVKLGSSYVPFDSIQEVYELN